MNCTLKLVLALLLAGCAALYADGPKQDASRPNIVFFMPDDMSYGDMSAFGQKQFRTPHLDVLVKEGLTFTQAYAGGPWCSPSRTSLLTGLRADRWRDKENVPELPTLGTLLQKAGYTTAMFGKWHLMDSPRKKISQRGFDRVLSGYNTPGLGGTADWCPHFPSHLMSDGKVITLEKNCRAQMDQEHAWGYNKPGGRNKCFDRDGNFKDLNGNTDLEYAEHIYREALLDFVRRDHDKPFFVYYCPPAPHGPLNVKDLGAFWKLPEESGGWNLARKSWARMIEEVDTTMGRLLAELKKQGLAENTLIIFTADNGYSAWGYQLNCADSPDLPPIKMHDDDIFLKHKGLPDDGGKFYNTNGGWHVPLVAFWPGTIPAGGECARVISFYDMMPTFATLAGIEVPWRHDGIDIAPLLSKGADSLPLRQQLVFPAEASYKLRKGDNPHDAAIMDERYLVQTIVPRDAPECAVTRLYDIIADPECENNLVDANSVLTSTLDARLRQVWRAR